jgi:hypothetical protein
MSIMKLLQEALGNDFGIIQERVGMSTIRRSRLAKIRAAAGKKALLLAKKRNDPALRKYLRLRALALAQKRKLQRKFKRKALALARRQM